MNSRSPLVLTRQRETVPPLATSLKRGETLHREDVVKAGATTSLTPDLLSQAQSLLSAVCASSNDQASRLVRFVACCDPGLAAMIAQAFSKVAALNCGQTLHVISGSLDSNSPDGRLEWAGPDSEIRSLHHASCTGFGSFDIDDNKLDHAAELPIPIKALRCITVDQSSQTLFSRQLQSSGRQELTILVVESGMSRVAEIEQTLRHLSVFGSGRVAFAFIKRGF